MKENFEKLIKKNVVLTMWFNKVQVKGEEVVIPNITIQRSYFDKKKQNWAYTSYLQLKNLVYVKELIEECIKKLEDKMY